MNCETMTGLIHGYMDGELDAVTNATVEEHLANCKSCTSELAQFQEMSQALRQPGLYHAAPNGFENTIRRATSAKPVAPISRRFDWRPYAAAVSLCFVLFGAWALTSIPRNGDRVTDDVVSSHIRSLMAAHLFDVASTDKHTVKPWFDGKLDFAPPVERLDDTQFPLAGGRLDYIDGHAAAALVYRHKKHIVNVFIWPDTHAAKQPTSTSERGYNVVRWNERNMACYAVSDMAAPDLLSFARLFAAQRD